MSRSPETSSSWQSLGNALRPLHLMAESETARRALMRMEIVKALAQDRICIALQPVVSTRSGHPVAFQETLLRIRTEDGIYISGAQFLPLVKSPDLAIALDCKALRLALSSLEADPGLRLSVNIARHTLGSQKWLDILDAAVERDAGIAYRLIAEVTEECALADISKTTQFLGALKTHGVTIALDDFGAGATSLAHLRSFRFDMVKIDGALVTKIAFDPDKQVILRSLVSVAQHFDMMVVAEFVENSADAMMLTSLGVDCLQGYLFGEPEVPLSNGPQPLS